MLPGFAWSDTLDKVAPEFPNTHFVLIDSVVDQPNVESVVFKSNDASYLAGVLAAKKSETGKVGFVGGMDIPLIHAFYCGYLEGVMDTNPDGTVFENYTGTTPDAWNDPVGAASSPRPISTRAPTSSMRRPAAPASACCRRPRTKASCRSASTPTRTTSSRARC